jgi:hypothetical protein
MLRPIVEPPRRRGLQAAMFVLAALALALGIASLVAIP